MLFTYLLVFLSSLIHASWNFLAKTIPSTSVFVWLVAVGCTFIYLPFITWFILNEEYEWNRWNVIVLIGTAVLHLVYFWVLQKGYQMSDLSVVYPVARGAGPVFSTLGAILIFKEEYNLLAGLGLLLIVVGVCLIAGLFDKKEKKNVKIGVYYGVATGLLIACYTLWDGYAVKQLKMSPIWVEYATHPFRVLVFLPVFFRKKQETLDLWQNYRLKILIISLVSPISFILFLYALQNAPISYLAPARELSIVIGVILGAKFLTEENFLPRLFGSLAIVGGILCLSYYR